MNNGYGHCSGLGDRMRGICLLLRIAAAYDMVFLVVWEQPLPLDNFLLPADIDWSLGPNLSRKLPADDTEAAAMLKGIIKNVSAEAPPHFVQMLRHAGTVRLFANGFLAQPFPEEGDTRVVLDQAGFMSYTCPVSTISKFIKTSVCLVVFTC